MASLFDIFSNKNAQDAANAQTQGYQQGYNQLSNLFSQGANSLNQNYAAGLAPVQQNYNTSQQGMTALGNALGLNGAQGNAAAVQAFQNNPGYQFQLDQGNQNILRNQAATGQLNSGGTNLDLLKYGQGLANQGWNQYIQNLQPYMGLAQNSAGQALQGYGNLGNQLAGLYQGQGNAAYGSQVGQANAQANADLANNQASQNMWNAIGQGVGLATNIASGGMGSNLFGMFGGGGSGIPAGAALTGQTGAFGWRNPDFG